MKMWYEPSADHNSFPPKLYHSLTGTLGGSVSTVSATEELMLTRFWMMPIVSSSTTVEAVSMRPSRQLRELWMARKHLSP
jgi:hypothetical protein